MYRPQTNVVSRPVAGIGKGYALVGHHEILIPLLAAALIEGDVAGMRDPVCGIRSEFALIIRVSSAGVAQLVRARGSYPRSPGFKSLHRHHFFLRCPRQAGTARC